MSLHVQRCGAVFTFESRSEADVYCALRGCHGSHARGEFFQVKRETFLLLFIVLLYTYSHPSLPCHWVCVNTQPTVQQMNNLAVCVSSVYRANPSVSRHLLIRACLVIVHPCHMHTAMSKRKPAHIKRHTHTHLCYHMICS